MGARLDSLHWPLDTGAALLHALPKIHICCSNVCSWQTEHSSCSSGAELQWYEVHVDPQQSCPGGLLESFVGIGVKPCFSCLPCRGSVMNAKVCHGTGSSLPIAECACCLMARSGADRHGPAGQGPLQCHSHSPKWSCEWLQALQLVLWYSVGHQCLSDE